MNSSSTPRGHLTARELAERSNMTVRTVRYYVSEGLLPPPDGATRSAMYDMRHLLRLRLISALQAEGLSLVAIRSRLVQLGDDGIAQVVTTLEHLEDALAAGDATALGIVEAAVAERSGTSTEIQESMPVFDDRPHIASAPPESAQAYIDTIMRKRERPRGMPSSTQADPTRTHGSEVWHHYTIEDGIEIRVRDDRLRPDRGQIDGFVDATRNLARRSIRRRDR
jgi:DNA-binding transcriptional MerR regulator